MLMVSCGAFRGIASGAAAGGGGGGATKLLTISGSTDATHAAWSLSSNYVGVFAFPDSAEGYNYNNTITNAICTSPVSGRAIVAARTIDGPGSEAYRIAEITVPTIYTGATRASIPNATETVSLFSVRSGISVDNGNWGANGARIGGLHVIDGNVLVPVYGAYAQDLSVGEPTGTDQAMMVVTNAASLSSANTKRGFFIARDEDTNSLLCARVAGWISEIPAALQASFGGTHLLGHSSGNDRSLNSRHSMGPSMYVYDANAAAAITGSSPPTNGADITFKCLANYPLGETTGLTPESLNNSPGQTWTNLSEAFIGFLVPGTYTYAVFGRSGGHNGPTDPSITYAGGFNPVNSSDFNSHYWLFDYRQHLEVLAGTRQPHQVECYEHGEVTAQWGAAGGQAWTGGHFDYATNQLYLCTSRADKNNGSAVVEIYDMSALAA